MIEQAAAKEAGKAAGFRCVVAGTLQDAVRLLDSLGTEVEVIVTDLHFPQKDGGDPNKPSGLAVVAEAVKRKIPVSVCTDADHHDAKYVEVVVATLSSFHIKPIGVIWRGKDWTAAFAAVGKEPA